MGTTYSLFNTRDRKDESQQQNSSHGALECTALTAVGASQQLHVERKSYMSFLSSIYADLFQQVLCVSLFFFLVFVFSTSANQHPLQV